MSDQSDQPTIAFVGGSLIHNGPWQAHFPEYRCLNLGVDGDTSVDLATRLESIIAEVPQAIVLGIGTNDVASNRSVELIVRTVENILFRLRRALPDTRILLHSLLPRGAEFSPLVREVNRHLWQFAPSVRAQYLDLWPALALGNAINPAFSIDRLHLNEAGYEAWVAELEPALEQLLSLPPTSRSILLPDARRA